MAVFLAPKTLLLAGALFSKTSRSLRVFVISHNSSTYAYKKTFFKDFELLTRGKSVGMAVHGK
jgi:hypothetical protein